MERAKLGANPAGPEEVNDERPDDRLETLNKSAMKLSFSLSSKPQTTLKKSSISDPTAATSKQESRVFVTEFDASQAPPTKADNKHIIPPKANEWRPAKKMKNLDLPLQSNGGEYPTLQFEVELASSTDPTSSDSVSYGLNLRNSTTNSNPSTVSSNGVDPLLTKLKDDLKRLPEDVGLDEFNDMPVEEFGRALLAGYGWTEGRGIGRNAKEDVKIVQYTKRTAKEGLGFTGELPPRNNRDDGRKKTGGKGESERVEGGGVQAGNNRDDGRKKTGGKGESERGEGGGVQAGNNRDDGRKKTGGKGDSERGEGGGVQAGNSGNEKGFYVGKDVRIVGGREIGMKGRILEVKRGGEVVVLRVLKSEEKVKVDIRDLADLGSVEEEMCLRKLKELRIREKRDVSDKSSSRNKNKVRDEETMSGMKESNRGREEIKGNESDKFSWLTNHIRVRIISKEIKGGRLYLKKGEVVDMVGPTTCDVAIDDSKELIQGVDQEQLETAIPKRGGPVLVLYGKHKGVYGSLVERDTEKEAGIVRDADTHELLNVRLEQIAEYVGDPSYIGY